MRFISVIEAISQAWDSAILHVHVTEDEYAIFIIFFTGALLQYSGAKRSRYHISPSITLNTHYNPPVLVPREILEGGTADEEVGGITSAHSHISSILQDANSKLLQGEFTFCPGRRLHSQTPNMVA